MTVPKGIDITTLPSLDAASMSGEATNTLALLLPHLALFSPPVLALLKSYYEQYGEIRVWAPVKGFGRVIVVYATENEAARAKAEGDWLELDLDVGKEGEAGGSMKQSPAGPYFAQRKRSYKANSLVLRLYALPATDLEAEAADQHLQPPAQSKNFLISPPGSPPEGWQPIVEDAPNAAPLASDLIRALELLQVNGASRRENGKEIILQTDVVRVEVEDCTGGGWMDVEEYVEGPHGRIGMVKATVDSMGGTGEGWRLPSQDLGSFTPGGKTRIMPTARPPVA